jgi:hypothetical protein
LGAVRWFGGTGSRQGDAPSRQSQLTYPSVWQTGIPRFASPESEGQEIKRERNLVG